MNEVNGSRPECSIVIQEQEDTLILGVAVPLKGQMTEAEFELAQVLFALALDIRVRMGRVL